MKFYVNKEKQSNGDHEVHTAICLFLPDKENRIELGEFLTCTTAVEEAQKFYANSNGCFFCSKPCHNN